MQSSIQPVFVIQFLHKVWLTEAVSDMTILCGLEQVPFLFIIEHCFLQSLSKLQLMKLHDFHIVRSLLLEMKARSHQKMETTLQC